MSKVNTASQACKAIGHINKISMDCQDCQEFAIERLGAIINSAEFERENLLKDIQKNKPKIEGGFNECVL
jgi:hypothetical protein